MWAPRDALEGMEDGIATSDLVLQVLDSLPSRQRRALMLRYLDEHSVAEVADTMEVSYQTAESLLARARRGFSTAWHSKATSDDTDPKTSDDRASHAGLGGEEHRR
jgi:DNA-directed RNA polymerase specialized sigma24 family protein